MTGAYFKYGCEEKVRSKLRNDGMEATQNLERWAAQGTGDIKSRGPGWGIQLEWSESSEKGEQGPRAEDGEVHRARLDGTL